MQHKLMNNLLMSVLLLFPLVSLADDVQPDLGNNIPGVIIGNNGKQMKEADVNFISGPMKAAVPPTTKFSVDPDAPPNAPDDLPNDPDLKPTTLCDYAIDETRKKKCQGLFFKLPSDMTNEEMILISEFMQLEATTIAIERRAEMKLLTELRNKEKAVTGGKGLGTVSDVKDKSIGWKAKTLIITAPNKVNPM